MASLSHIIIIVSTAYDPLEIHLMLYYVCVMWFLIYSKVLNIFSQPNVVNAVKMIALGTVSVVIM